MRRSIKGLALLAVIPLALGACGDNGEEEDNGGSPAAISTDPATVSGTVTFWDTSNSTSEAPVFQELISQFEAAYPNVTVEYTNVPFSDARDKYKTAAQADEAPDVMRTEVAWTPEFASLGYLYPLDGTPLDTPDAYLPATWTSNQYEGKVYGVPQVTDAPGLMYNKALLEQAGVEVPKTWDDISANASKFQTAGINGLYGAVEGYILLPYIYSYGGDMLDIDAQTVRINDADSVEGWTKAAELISSGAAVKPNANDAYNTQMVEFKDGKVAMMVNGPWAVADVLTGQAFSDPNNLGVATTPAGSQEPGTPVGGHNYTIYAGTPDLDASVSFIAFMNSPESQAFLAGELGLLPTTNAAWELPEVTADPFVSLFKPVLDTGVARPWIPQGGELLKPMDAQWIKTYNEGLDAQTATDNVATEWLGILPDYTD